MIAPTVSRDLLDLIAAEGRDLLRRVDLVVEHLGTPAGHPLLPLLGRLRLRSGEALRALLDTSPDELLAVAVELRKQATAYRDDLVGPLRRSVADLGWGGPGFAGFAARWAAQAQHLAGPDGTSLAGRLELTADFAELVAGWYSEARQGIAAVLLEAFGSAQAVVLRACPALDGDAAGLRRAVITGEIEHGDRLAGAAADLGAAVLGAVSRWYEEAAEALPAGDWATRLELLPEPRIMTLDDPDDFRHGWVNL